MRILNFGSLNIDHVYRVDHISAPGETVTDLELQYQAGGKGLNQSIALAKSGVTTYHVGCVGKDGGMLLSLLEQAGVKTDYLKPVDELNGHAIIQVSKDGQNSIIIHKGSNQAIRKEDVDWCLEQVQPGDLVLTQNETSQVPYLAEVCRQKKIPLAFNPSPFTSSLMEEFPFEAVTYLLINETEGQQISGRMEPEKIVDMLLEKYPNMRIVLTLGADGVLYADRNCRIRQAAFPVQAVDTTGAGDTFTGFFLGSVLQQRDIQTALRNACAAAAISVTGFGAAVSIPTMQRVEEFLEGR